MAARVCRNGSLLMCAMAVMAALLSVGGGGVAGRVVEEGCPEMQYAYPFQSTCQYPAEFGTEYHLVSPFSNARVAQGGLTSSELNNKVRFTGNKEDEGARYVLTAVDSKNTNITIGTRFTIQNVATKKFFAHPLTEKLTPTILYEAERGKYGVSIAQFVLELACDVSLPCPSTPGARCLSYHLKLANYGTYVFPVHRDGLTYTVVAAKEPLGAYKLPLLLRRVKYFDIVA